MKDVKEKKISAKKSAEIHNISRSGLTRCLAKLDCEIDNYEEIDDSELMGKIQCAISRGPKTVL